MNIINTFIGDFCGEGNSNPTYIWICVTIAISFILICLTIWMILNYLKEKQIREEEQEIKIMEKQKTMDDFASIKNNLCEIHKKLDEIRSEMDSRS